MPAGLKEDSHGSSDVVHNERPSFMNNLLNVADHRTRTLSRVSFATTDKKVASYANLEKQTGEAEGTGERHCVPLRAPLRATTLCAPSRADMRLMPPSPAKPCHTRLASGDWAREEWPVATRPLGVGPLAHLDPVAPQGGWYTRRAGHAHREPGDIRADLSCSRRESRVPRAQLFGEPPLTGKQPTSHLCVFGLSGDSRPLLPTVSCAHMSSRLFNARQLKLPPHRGAVCAVDVCACLWWCLCVGSLGVGPCTRDTARVSAQWPARAVQFLRRDELQTRHVVSYRVLRYVHGAVASQETAVGTAHTYNTWSLHKVVTEMFDTREHHDTLVRYLQIASDVPQPRLGEICRKVSFWRTIVLRPLAALRPTTASEMKAIPL
jgi:hypothetical protein